MKIRAEKVTGGELRPGDLFSTAGPVYWEYAIAKWRANPGVGEKVYIRTPTPCPEGSENEEVYRITIDLEQEETLADKLAKALGQVEIWWLCSGTLQHHALSVSDASFQVWGVSDALDEYERVTGKRLDRGRGE